MIARRRLQGTSANKPYDSEATRDDEVLIVEVKGTTSDTADAIAMTHGEVDIHRREKGHTALMIITGIRLDNEGATPIAHGDSLEAIVGWDIDAWNLHPSRTLSALPGTDVRATLEQLSASPGKRSTIAIHCD